MSRSTRRTEARCEAAAGTSRRRAVRARHIDQGGSPPSLPGTREDVDARQPPGSVATAPAPAPEDASRWSQARAAGGREHRSRQDGRAVAVRHEPPDRRLDRSAPGRPASTGERETVNRRRQQVQGRRSHAHGATSGHRRSPGWWAGHALQSGHTRTAASSSWAVCSGFPPTHTYAALARSVCIRPRRSAVVCISARRTRPFSSTAPASPRAQWTPPAYRSAAAGEKEKRRAGGWCVGEVDQHLGGQAVGGRQACTMSSHAREGTGSPPLGPCPARRGHMQDLQIQSALPPGELLRAGSSS